MTLIYTKSIHYIHEDASKTCKQAESLRQASAVTRIANEQATQASACRSYDLHEQRKRRYQRFLLFLLHSYFYYVY